MFCAWHLIAYSSKQMDFLDFLNWLLIAFVKSWCFYLKVLILKAYYSFKPLYIYIIFLH